MAVSFIGEGNRCTPR